MNAALYGLGRGKGSEWLMVDVGVSFGGPETPGVDLDACRTSLRRERSARTSPASCITHAHEDHFGALIDAVAEAAAQPVYMTEFAAGCSRSAACQEPGATEDPDHGGASRATG